MLVIRDTAQGFEVPAQLKTGACPNGGTKVGLSETGVLEFPSSHGREMRKPKADSLVFEAPLEETQKLAAMVKH